MTLTASVPNWAYALCNNGGSGTTAGLQFADYGTPVPGYTNMFSYGNAPGLGFVFKENGVSLPKNRFWSIGPNGGYYYYGPATWTIEVYKIGNVANYISAFPISMFVSQQAAGTIQVYGYVSFNPVASTCTAYNLTIPLGDVYSDVFTAVGTPSPTSPNYNLSLYCQGKPQVTMSISGTAVPGNTGLFGLNASANTASGVAVQLFRSGSAVTQGQKYVVSSAAADGWLYIPMQARYMRTGDISPGAANANMIATFTYN
jgi:type 1 fimbria pilin